MGFVLFLIFLLGVTVGYCFGRWSGYSTGLAKGKKDGKQDCIEEGRVAGIKDYLRKELIESKAIGGKYEVAALNQARKELQEDILPKSKKDEKKSENSSLLGWILVLFVILWALQAICTN